MNLLVALVVLALSAAGAYYVYLGIRAQDARPSCANLLAGCTERCSGTATDSEAVEACQSKCRDDSKSCEAR
jgi:uncharacterized protein (UPF0333 family)